MKAARLLFTLFLLAVIGVSLNWLAASVVARPINRPVAPPPAPAREVRLTASDGVPIAGSYWPGASAEAPAVLLLHGINNNRGKFARQAAWLNGLGYAVLAIDHRGHGNSGAVERSFGWIESRDVAAAIAFLRRDRPDRKVGIIGVSLGGAAALLGEDGPAPVEAMVLHAVYPSLRTAIANRLERSGSTMLAAWAEPLLSWQSRGRYGVAADRIAPAEAIRSYRGEVLIVAGTADRETRIADSRRLHAAAPGAKSLFWAEGADHVATSKLWTPEYRARVRCLFDRRLGEPRHRDAPAPLGAPCANSPSS